MKMLKKKKKNSMISLDFQNSPTKAIVVFACCFVVHQGDNSCLATQWEWSYTAALKLDDVWQEDVSLSLYTCLLIKIHCSLICHDVKLLLKEIAGNTMWKLNKFCFILLGLKKKKNNNNKTQQYMNYAFTVLSVQINFIKQKILIPLMG